MCCASDAYLVAMFGLEFSLEEKFYTKQSLSDDCGACDGQLND